CWQSGWRTYSRPCHGRRGQPAPIPPHCLRESLVFPELPELIVHEDAVSEAVACIGGTRLVFSQAEDGIRVATVTGVQTCALPISSAWPQARCPKYARVRLGPRVRRADAGVLWTPRLRPCRSRGHAKPRRGIGVSSRRGWGPESGRAACRERVWTCMATGAVRRNGQ